ncbi:hypothetical protein PsorP6_006357 [Peronosclerospora sorghi]|uniref:Uncharacterized protein n=1 Tax=Peronosclerospora sorghi TaxID=230839 RepID=A0ACC0W543_9STRA|nr:hypothetical protein PsorP6_006357 [Peronosclerospora sorghi]
MVVCSVRLVCSYECGLLCHWPEATNTIKIVTWKSNRLDDCIRCSVVTACVRGVSIFDEALKKYLCDIQVEVTLPCGHNEKMKCSSYSAIQGGAAAWPVCNRDAVTPFVYPECKHIENVHAMISIDSLRDLPLCAGVHTDLSTHLDVIVPCAAGFCYQRAPIGLQREGPSIVATSSHEAVVSCPTAESLKQWTGEACTVGCYGPKDHFCKQTVTFQRCCGHSEEVRCERAFELVQNPSRCQEAVVMTNTECVHNCSTTCYEEKRLENKVAQYCSDADDLEPLESVHEGDASNYRNYGLSLQYSQKVTYVRRCGHSKKMKCSEARHMTAECRKIVTTKLLTCMHVVHVACHLTKQLSTCRPWQERTQSIELLHDESVVVETLGMPSGACPPALKRF